MGTEVGLEGHVGYSSHLPQGERQAPWREAQLLVVLAEQEVAVPCGLVLVGPHSGAGHVKYERKHMHNGLTGGPAADKGGTGGVGGGGPP